MTIIVGVFFLCIASGLTWALTSNPKLKEFSGFVFTASFAALLVGGARAMGLEGLPPRR
jgi:hypothetical protein